MTTSRRSFRRIRLWFLGFRLNLAEDRLHDLKRARTAHHTSRLFDGDVHCPVGWEAVELALINEIDREEKLIERLHRRQEALR